MKRYRYSDDSIQINLLYRPTMIHPLHSKYRTNLFKFKIDLFKKKIVAIYLTFKINKIYN